MTDDVRRTGQTVELLQTAAGRLEAPPSLAAHGFATASARSTPPSATVAEPARPEPGS